MLFDVFGTVVDWRSSVSTRLAKMESEIGIKHDWTAFADRWRGLYQPSMEAIRLGQRPFELLDDLHRENLIALLEQLGTPINDDAALDRMNKVWHQLDGWSDSAEGLGQLRGVCPCVSLSNGNIGLMANLARHADLRWDAIMGSEVARTFKPRPEVYLGAARSFGLKPEQCMMVAAHNDDLAAARSLGLKTAFILRPTEYGPNQTTNLKANQDWDFEADSLIDLASQLSK